MENMEHKTYNVDKFYNEVSGVLHFMGKVKAVVQNEIMLLEKVQTRTTGQEIKLTKFKRYTSDIAKFSIDFSDYTVILAGFFTDKSELNTLDLSLTQFKEYHVSLQELIEAQNKFNYDFIFEDALYDEMMNETLYEEFDSAMAFVNLMAYKFIYSLLSGREFTLQNGKSYRVDIETRQFASREMPVFTNLADGKKLNCATSAFVALIRNEIETELTEQELNSMIDIALDTRDFDWVNKLLEQKKNLTQAQ